MRSYEAARSLFSFLGFMAWSVIILGVLIAFVGASGAGKFGGAPAALGAMIPGVAIAIAGFIELAFVQMGRASVDTAEYTQQMLKIARDQLEVSQQSIKSTRQQIQTFAQLNTETKSNMENTGKGFGAFQNSGTSNAEQKTISIHESGMMDGDTQVHSGHTITFKDGKFRTAGASFASLELAEQYIDRTYKDAALVVKR
jgi:hypothetical protein